MGLMRQQYDHACLQLSNHILALQDLYFTGFATRTTEFELSAQLVAPTMPASPIHARRAEEKLDFLIDQYTQSADAEIQRFYSDSIALRRDLDSILVKAEQDAKANERRRFDEFVQATTLCRREVSAAVALVKSEQAHSQTEVSAMSALKASLEEVSKELDAVRARSEKALAEAHVSHVKQRSELIKELEQQRAAFELERNEVSEQMRALINQQGALQAKYAKELSALAQEGADRMADTSERMTRLQSDLNTANAELLALKSELARRDRDSGMETLQLRKTIGSLELENERLKLALDSERDQHSFATEDVRRAVDARRNAEVEQFKRRLIDSVSVGSAGSPHHHLGSSTVVSPGGPFSPHRTSASFQQQQQPLSSSRIRASLPRDDRSASQLAEEYRHDAASPKHHHRADDVVAAAGGSPFVNNHQPSDAYLRLQSLASSWKDRLATSPGHPSASPKPWV